jgi:Uma2 family endonuclease
MAGPRNVDLATQPPPDLAIEVEVSRSASKALAIYARMGVPEVWRLDVKRGTLTFLALNEAGAYEPTPRSKNLPVLAPSDVLEQLRLAEELGSTSRWFARLADWVRVTLLPRLGGG